MKENVSDLGKWTPASGDTGVTLFIEMDHNKGSRGRMSSILHNLPVFMQVRLNLDGSRFHADLGVLYDLVNDPNVQAYDQIKCLRYALQRLYPQVFGEAPMCLTDIEKRFSKDFRILENQDVGDVPTEGYHIYSCGEPLVLEPEDWTPVQWETLCKLCGLTKVRASRIVMNVDSIETFVESSSTTSGTSGCNSREEVI